MTTYQTKSSANKFWDNVIFHVDNITGSSLPTVTTDSLNMLFNLNAHITGTVVSQGSSDVTEYGFVWAYHDNPTLDDNVIVVGSDAFTGGYANTTPGGTFDFFTTVYFAAYATNMFGTSYGAVLSGESQICFAEGTLVTAADGSKMKIEDVGYDDDLLVWNFDDGVFGSAKPVWILKPFKSYYYGLVKFSNGAELRTVADGRGHRIYNIDKDMFTFSMDIPVGTRTLTEKKEIVNIVSKEVIRKETNFYNIITHTHINIFANEILTSTGLNNIYPIYNMRFIKDNRELAKKENFNVSDELFTGLRLSELSNYPNIENKLKMMVQRQLMRV